MRENFLENQKVRFYKFFLSLQFNHWISSKNDKKMKRFSALNFKIFLREYAILCINTAFLIVIFIGMKNYLTSNNLVVNRLPENVQISEHLSSNTKNIFSEFILE